MDIKGKRVFVTGAGGFIGSHLTEQLVRSGARVRAMVHYSSSGSWANLEQLPKEILSEVEVFQGDVVDPFSVKKGVQGSDVVFHLASLIAIPYSYVAPQSYVSTNVLGTLNVMQAALELGVSKVVHTSTSETYGTAIYAPIDEKHPLQGQSPYSATKIGADKVAESYFLSFGLPVATLRPFNTYGPRQSARAVIPTIISQVLSGATEIKLGSLDPIRDFNYVLDTVAGFVGIAMSESSAGQVINVGHGKGISIGDLVQLISEVTGKSISVQGDQNRVRPDKSEVMKLICDNRKAKEVFDWEPKYSLKQGLTETAQYIAQNLHRYKPTIYNV